jgi:hypothetical protein
MLPYQTEADVQNKRYVLPYRTKGAVQRPQALPDIQKTKPTGDNLQPGK